VLNDKWGRKNIFFIIAIISCISTYMMPLIHHIYPWFLICRFGVSFFSFIIYASPIPGDYAESSSQGKASGLFAVFKCTGYLSASGVSALIIGREESLK
jgi:MFS family permease